MLKKVVCVLVLVCTISIGFSQSKIDSLKTVLEKTTDDLKKITVLDDLTQELVRNNNAEQESYLKAYLTLAKNLKEFDLMASKSRFLIQFYIYKDQATKAKKWCDSILHFKPFFKKESSEAHVLLKRAAIFYDQENYEEAIKDYDKATVLFMASKDSIFAADALFFKGQAASDNNQFLEALDSYKEASSLYELLGDQQYAILAGAELTSLYNKNGFIEKSITIRERLIKKARNDKDYISLAQLIGQNINSYYKLGDYEKMKVNIDAFILIKDSSDSQSLKEYSKSFATIYKLFYACGKKDKTTAKELMDALLLISDSDNVSKYIQNDILEAKAAYYQLIENEEKLIPVLQSLVASTNTNRLNSQIKARSKLADIYKKNGQYLKSIELKDYNKKLSDSMNSAQKNNRFLFYQSQFEAERKQRELLEKDAKIQQLQIETTKRNTLIVAIVSIFMIAIAYFYLRNRQKIKEQAYQNILLNNKVATKTEEINELLTETIQHIKSKERIAENLQKLSNEKEGITLKSIIADLKANKADNAKLLLIKQNIEQVNFEFIKKLKELHPELSKTDIEICSLARIGLSRKEIANLRNTSIDAVKMSRIRIKKKLNLTTEQGLDDYINSL
ncbi:tetratricopeptide repeat protein [uncultured Kordia sp.]|uniref:tetratricopeptide repeat protein n=1 Tax=uncultured Kordia sp. TaxID=507699 RepID=UPI002631412D|nr:tetratricopeptide repeat protein [uncultured Kordia sp.]